MKLKLAGVVDKGERDFFHFLFFSIPPQGGATAPSERFSQNAIFQKIGKIDFDTYEVKIPSKSSKLQFETKITLVK